MESRGIILRLVAVIALTVATACSVSAQQDGSGPSPIATPIIQVDANGLYSVADCPTTHDVLEVKLQENEEGIDKVLIYADGMLMQSIQFRQEDCVTSKDVHFLDANFDGNVDILIGPGTNREYSVLIVWDREENRFARATNDGFNIFNGDFYYEPERMAVYRMTSSSAFETTYTLMVWQGTDLQSEEQFIQVADPSYYDSYHVTHRYTLRNYYSDEDAVSTDDPKAIFEPWNKWVIANEN
jgi:hypothetical protein